MNHHSNNKKSLISVILPVYNAERYFAQAIESILNQTYPHFELIIVDDCSTDGSLQIALQYAKEDSRIRVFKTKKRLPVGAVSNLAIEKSRGEFIARMDADDISMPDRLAKQLMFLKSHPALIGVGGQCQLIDSHNKPMGYRTFPVHPIEVEEMMFYNYPVQSPTFMVRASVLPSNFVWYEEKVESAEEHELLFKLHQYGKVANLPYVTLRYRVHKKSTSHQHPKRDFFHIFEVRMKAIVKYQYLPSFSGLFKGLAELLVIVLFPEKWMMPAYLFISKYLFQQRALQKAISLG